MGNKKENLIKAEQLISNLEGIKVLESSSYYITKAWGKEDQADFLNSALMIQTNLKPVNLLKKLQEVENKLGRIRNEKWGERSIDIDILTYEQSVVNLPQLTIPHPYIEQRAFVLAPLLELDDMLFIPKKGTVKELWENLKDKSGLSPHI